jgi:transposase InsO family protein
MRVLVILLVHLIATVARLIGPGGVRSVVAESLLVKHQLLIINRSRQRAPNLQPVDRVVAGLCSLFMRPTRVIRSAIVLRPSTILAFHNILKKRKYRLLFSPKRRGRPGPKGPSLELIAAVVEMKQRNPRWGCRHIAQQITYIFGVYIDKDVVRRILAKHYHPGAGDNGPSWLTFLGHTKDSLWSTDLFRCESLILKTHWVLVVMDQYTRRIIGFGVRAGIVDGPALCRMFNAAIAGHNASRYLSTDNDPLFKFHRWKANLRILEIDEIKTVPSIPLSHPFVERLIGTIRRDYLDHVPFWSATDLQRKLSDFQHYYNSHRVHSSLDGLPPSAKTSESKLQIVRLANYRWKPYCRGLYQLPVAA